ncbi:MAG: hypothetical protein ACI85O_002993, partial [Saprospiraceae bacterium]
PKNFINFSIKKGKQQIHVTSLKVRRGGRIRTCDPLFPKYNVLIFRYLTL